MSTEHYPAETLGADDDDGTMEQNVGDLTNAVVGHRIVRVERDVDVPGGWYGTTTGTAIVLDSGKRVTLAPHSDCCAYTELDSFLLHPELVDHVITGVGTTGGYTTWHIYADMGDVLELSVAWSCGNPFYYGYGFTITVLDS
jgi:hypothetical protein